MNRKLCFCMGILIVGLGCAHRQQSIHATAILPPNTYTRYITFEIDSGQTGLSHPIDAFPGLHVPSGQRFVVDFVSIVISVPHGQHVAGDLSICGTGYIHLPFSFEGQFGDGDTFVCTQHITAVGDSGAQSGNFQYNFLRTSESGSWGGNAYIVGHIEQTQ